MTYDLPTSLDVDGESYAIRSDFRAIIDICIALNDPELSDEEKGYVSLAIFYPDLKKIPISSYEAAIKKCFWFIDGGEDIAPPPDTRRLMSWEQDFSLIVAPINRVMGKEVRSVEYLHWWTFIAAYKEIGDCLFAQIVNIRSKRAKGKKLDKSEQEFYRQNHTIIDIKTTYTETEDAFFARWGVK